MLKNPDTLTPSQFKKEYKALSPKDLQDFQRKLDKAGRVLYYQEAGRNSVGDKKYRLYVVLEGASTVMRGKPVIEDVTYILSNIIGNRYNKADQTLTLYPNVHQWDRVLNDKLNRDLTTMISLLGVQ